MFRLDASVENSWQYLINSLSLALFHFPISLFLLLFFYRFNFYRRNFFLFNRSKLCVCVFPLVNLDCTFLDKIIDINKKIKCNWDKFIIIISILDVIKKKHTITKNFTQILVRFKDTNDIHTRLMHVDRYTNAW